MYYSSVCVAKFPDWVMIIMPHAITLVLLFSCLNGMECLNKKWNVQIKNKFGDCEFVTEGTFCFWMKLRSPLDDFVEVGDKFLPYKFEQELLLIVRFVRETGNSRKYRELFRI